MALQHASCWHTHTLSTTHVFPGREEELNEDVRATPGLSTIPLLLPYLRSLLLLGKPISPAHLASNATRLQVPLIRTGFQFLSSTSRVRKRDRVAATNFHLAPCLAEEKPFERGANQFAGFLWWLALWENSTSQRDRLDAAEKVQCFREGPEDVQLFLWSPSSKKKKEKKKKGGRDQAPKSKKRGRVCVCDPGSHKATFNSGLLSIWL